MQVAELVLEYLRLFLSAPVIAGAIALAFLLQFRAQIAGLIDRIWRIKFPGGELSTSQEERSRELVRPTANVEPSAPAVALPSTLSTVSPQQAAELKEILKSERSHATLWEYRYLNYFLVRGTQMVLDWLASQPGPVSVRLLDSFLQPVIPQAMSGSPSYQLLRLITSSISLTMRSP